MLISKNLAKYLKSVYELNNKHVDKKAIADINNGVLPWLLNNPKDTGCFKKILYITEPICKAVDSFVLLLNETIDIATSYYSAVPDHSMVIIYRRSVFLLKSNRDKVEVCCYSPDATKFVLSIFNPKDLNEFGVPNGVMMHSPDLLRESADKIHVSNMHLLALLIFLDKTEMQEKVIPANTKNKSKRKELENTNLSEFDVIRVDNTYFTKIFVEGAFGVKAHPRKQRYGKGLSEWKIVYIEPYVKSGYTRRSDIELGKAI